MWHIRNGINVMEYFKPGEQMTMMYYSVSNTGKFIIVIIINRS